MRNGSETLRRYLRLTRRSPRGARAGALQLSGARVRSTLDSLFEGCQILDRDWRYVYVNPAAARHGGKSVSELIGRTIMDAYPGIEETELFVVLRRCMNERVAEKTENAFVLPDGSISWFQLAIEPVDEGLFILSVDITEQKRADAEAREAREQLTVVMDNLEEGLVVAELNGRFLHWNAAAARMHGLALQEDWRGEFSRFATVFDLYTRDNVRMPLEEWPLVRVLRGENVRNFEARIRRREDQWERILSYTGSIVHYGDDQSLAFLTITDITEHRLAEEQLRATNERVHQLLEHSSAVIVAMTVENGKIATQFVSGHILRLLGFTPEETMADGWWQGRLHPEDRERAMTAMALTIRDGFNRHEYRIRHKDGTYRWLDDSLSLVRHHEGRAEVVGVLTDVTDRRRAQDELRESERRFRSMLGNLGLIAIMLDPEGRVTYCNDHLLRLTGWSREDVIGSDWFAVFIPDSLQEDVHAMFSALLVDAPQAWHHENEILTRDGHRRMIRWNNSVLRASSGMIIGVASIGEDITERKNLERQIVRKQRLESLGTLAGGIAHDLNNILMPIVMGATLLRRFEHGPQALKAIDNIERSVKRGSDLVKQVLLFARGSETSRSIVYIPSVVRDLDAMIRSTFPKNIAFNVSLDFERETVMGDATQLVQVLLNLCVNARDAMPKGGSITLTAKNEMVSEDDAQSNGGRPGMHVVLEVKDTGEGMPKEVMERIFDPFFTTKEVGKGTGLGLSTAQGIIGSHGGFITVASEPAHGTSFCVYLPAMEE